MSLLIVLWWRAAVYVEGFSPSVMSDMAQIKELTSYGSNFCKSFPVIVLSWLTAEPC